MADVKYYRTLLKDQTNLLDSQIEKLNKILNDDSGGGGGSTSGDEIDGIRNNDHSSTLPESVVGQIHLVIGQSKLFINERFKQFSGLIDDCEYKRGEKKILVEDLAGFWDMISYQIDDLKSKYNELEQLELNNWKPIEKQQKSSTSSNIKTTAMMASSESSTISASTNKSMRKPLQATNGRHQPMIARQTRITNTKTMTNGKVSNNNNNNNDTTDGEKRATKPVKSNFREFLKNKVKLQEQKRETTTATTVVVENGSSDDNTTSKSLNGASGIKDGHDNDDAQVIILFDSHNNHHKHHNNNNNNDNELSSSPTNKTKNGNLEKEI